MSSPAAMPLATFWSTKLKRTWHRTKSTSHCLSETDFGLGNVARIALLEAFSFHTVRGYGEQERQHVTLIDNLSEECRARKTGCTPFR
jgi:hypothetical protein